MSVLGGRIKYLREKRGWVQQDVCDKTGLTIVQLSRYETNDRKPDPETLASLADALETTTDYLVGRTSDWRDKKKGDIFVAEEEVELIEQLRKYSEDIGMELGDPRFQNLFGAAFDIVKRIAAEK